MQKAILGAENYLIDSRNKSLKHNFENVMISRNFIGLKLCLVIFKDLNDPESLLFTECQNLILFKSYCNFNFGNLVGSLINLRTKMKF